MKEAVDSFLNHLVVEKGFSTNTLEAYRNDLTQFISFAEDKRTASSDGNSTGHASSNGTWNQVD